ncbi:MAG: arcadin 1 [Thermofilum sp.]
MSAVVFRARVTNISLIDSPTGEKLVRIELSEERELPGPVVIQREESELSRELVPVLSQIFRMLPGMSQGSYRLPRLTLILTEDEWDKLLERPSIGDVFEVEVKTGKIGVGKES